MTYFIGAVLDTAGYRTAIQQTNINLGYSCFQFVFALIGSAFVDKIGRRRLMLTGMAGCAVVWVGMTTASGLFNETQNASAAKATVAMIFMFGAIFSFCLTPLQALYPGKSFVPMSKQWSRRKGFRKIITMAIVVLVVILITGHHANNFHLVEVLSFEMRAKGMAFSSLAVNVGGLLNQFAWPVSLKNIGWKTYIIFIIWVRFARVPIVQVKSHQMAFRLSSVPLPCLYQKHADCTLAFSAQSRL